MRSSHGAAPRLPASPERRTAHGPRERATAALRGVAVGDAVGKPAEGLWPWVISQKYGGRITGLLPMGAFASRDGHLWRRGQVTDDTISTLRVAGAVLEHGRVEREAINAALASAPIDGWPAWGRFHEAVKRGQPRLRRSGIGAAMRIAPVGLLHPPDRPRDLAFDVALTCDSHYSRTAVAAACMVAGAVSAAIEGWGRDEVLAFALKMAERGESLIPEGPAPAARYLVLNTVERVRSGTAAPAEAIAGLAAAATADDAAALAMSLAYFAADAREAILEAANLGGDADTVASIAGGIAAALSPDTLPPEWVLEVERVNDLDLAAVARRLCDLRVRPPSP